MEEITGADSFRSVSYYDNIMANKSVDVAHLAFPILGLTLPGTLDTTDSSGVRKMRVRHGSRGRWVGSCV